MYTIINDFLLSLLPTTLTPQMEAWSSLASLTILTMLVWVCIKMVVWAFKLTAGLFRW